MVLIDIISDLISKHLTPVQKVREAAARAQCANNLKQIGLAFHNHHDQLGFYPTAGSGDSGNPPTNRLDWGWTYEILPFIEQQNAVNVTNNTTLRQTIITLYYCKSRRQPGRYRGGWAKSDYAGSGGTNPTAGTLNNGFVVRSKGSNNSVPQSHIGVSNIHDGLSNTLAVGEKFFNQNLSSNDTVDNESWAGPGFGDGDIIRGAIPIPGSTPTRWRIPMRDTVIPNPTASSPYGEDLDYMFGSNHPTGMNALLGDGSVRLVRFNVDTTVFMRLVRREDNQQFNPDNL
jgi:hypothetical protein